MDLGCGAKQGNHITMTGLSPSRAASPIRLGVGAVNAGMAFDQDLYRKSVPRPGSLTLSLGPVRVLCAYTGPER
jgi:hypothetical protein